MAWTANALARQLNCAWVTIKGAIKRGELKAVWDGERRAWLIEDGRELTFFKARLDYLRNTRQQRRERMKSLWRTGKLKPRRRKSVPLQIVERTKRPLLVQVGQGIYGRTSPIHWHGNEGETCCPSCGASLKVR